MIQSQKKVELRSAILELVEADILQVTTTADYETSIDDIEEIHNTSLEMTLDNPHFILVITKQGASSSNETREYAAKKGKERKILGEAIVIKNVALRMAATVYMKVNRPKQKIKLFNTREKAIAWIYSQRKNN